MNEPRWMGTADDLIDSRDMIEFRAWADSEEFSVEIASIDRLAEEGISDWEHGETLIKDSYFEEYAKDLAGDLGCITGDEKWPLSCIDWKKAASELQQDYILVRYLGIGYWVRT